MLSDEESSNNQDDRLEDEEASAPKEETNGSSLDAPPSGSASAEDELIDVDEFLNRLHAEFSECSESARRSLEIYFSWAVPYCYKLEKSVSPLDKTQPQCGTSERAEKLLFPVLNGFLDKDNQLTNFYQTLDGQRTSVCGRVFKVGETTYNCRDCGMDPTCVLCSDCFNNSEHKNHRYKMTSSGGSGYCDCGDVEAWKSDHYCSLHQPLVQDSSNTLLLPSELRNRANFLFEILLHYAYTLLTSKLALSLPQDVTFNEYLVTTRLPETVTSCVKEELFCTVLYNDEDHTFDTVISTLQRALQCTQRDGVDYATKIDREGRCVVKIDDFQKCSEAKVVIERYTSRNEAKPLKVVVMQSHLVAHQIFSLKLLKWIERILEKSGDIRDLFASVVQGSPVKCLDPTKSLLEGIMLNDTKLWKSARTTWHHLLIAGMLKDYHLKKRFATLFVKNYADLMKAFVTDDHEYPFSITSLSVQIFTVPTIAHYLIENEDAFFTIMKTLMSECEQQLNSGTSIQEFIIEDGKLEFDRRRSGSMLKSITFIIIDLKYILTTPPTTWTDALVQNFNRGMEYFLRLLCAMQEIDSVTRQTGNHVEYEPGWESAVNLQLKLQPVLTLSMEWLAANKNIFIHAFSFCLKQLAKEYNSQVNRKVIKEFANHSANCLVYDVSTEPVSVHLPLTRFFAGLYIYLEQHGLEFASTEFQMPDKPVPEILMEPSLRTQVLVAQAHAGMWKRNGYSLWNQLFFYHNVRCRTDMLDKDIISLQIGASLIEPNRFLVHVLNRFDLLQWADQTFYDQCLENVEDDLYKHTSSIFSDFLGLIINIFAARYVPGVGQVTKKECLKKEIIQLLCIEPMAHSALSKGLVENVNNETGLETVILDVAIFKKANNAGQGGVYELKPEFYKEYDSHHFHYTREEMSRSEERQRERKRSGKESEFFPPPCLPPFASTFNLVVNILMCDVLLKMLALVLQRSMKKTKILNDSHLSKALHLIGHGLNEETARKEKEEEHTFQFCEACQRWNIFELLDSLLKEAHLSQHHDMILWIRKQKSKILPGSDTLPVKQTHEPVQPNDEEEKRKRARMAAETKAKVLANMAAAQQKFMAVNADHFENDDAQDPPVNDEKETNPVFQKNVALGPNQTPFRQDDETYVCILCREEHALSISSKGFVLAAFVQRSSVLCEARDELRAKGEDKSFEFLEKSDVWFRRNQLISPHVSSCGHIMHEACWTSHLEGVINKERRRPYRLSHPSFDVGRQEWLCPMCDCICNAALPMAIPLHTLYPITTKLTQKDVAKVFLPTTEYAEGKTKEVTVGEMEIRPAPLVPSLLANADLSPDITGLSVCVPPPQKNELPPEENAALPSTKIDDQSSSYKVWLKAMEIMDRITNNNQPYEDDTAKVGEDEGPFQKIIFTRNFIKTMEQQGVPGERLMEIFHGGVNPDHEGTANWFHPKFDEALITFMERVQTVACDKAPDDPDWITCQLHRILWQSLAYTIMSAEAYHRDQKISFFGENVPIRRSMALKFLTRVCSLSVDSQFFSPSWVQMIRSELLQYMASIWHADPDKPCVLELDAFGLLVFLTYLMPFALCHTGNQNSSQTSEDDDLNPDQMKIQPPVGSHLDHHNLRLVYTIHVFQLLVSTDNMVEFTGPHDEKCDCLLGTVPLDLNAEVENCSTGFDTIDKLRSLLFYLWAKPRETLTEDSPARRVFLSIRNHLDCDKLWEHVTQKTIPFLRCCAKFYESMTGISPPTGLEKVESSFEDLTSYLDLPKTFYELFDSSEAAELAMRWSRHPSMRIAVNPLDAESSNDLNLKYLPKLSLPRTLRPLVSLPDDYADLINSVSLFKCTKCEPHDSRMPTMCLICGEILCSQSYSCQQEFKKERLGACTYHAYFCGGGIGIFLRIRECRLFLLSGHNKGCHMLPPYLDKYGETDQGLRRGNPMTLSREKYDHFRRLWISHEIPEEIARITEHNNSFPTTEWMFL